MDEVQGIGEHGNLYPIEEGCRTFLVVAAGHSGSKLLSMQLGQAPGWTVTHEAGGIISDRLAEKRFQGVDRYGEVNTYLLTCARYIPASKKAVLLRNPHDIVRSICRAGADPKGVIIYVREAISTLDCLIRDGFPIILFRRITRNRKYVLRVADMLGVDGLAEETVNVLTKINHHPGAEAALSYDRETTEEFDAFAYRYRL